MKKSVINARLAEMDAQTIEQGLRMVREGYGALGISQNAPITLKQANALHAFRDSQPRGEQPVSHGPRSDWKAIMAPTPPSDRALLLMVADECDITNPDGSPIPLTPALVALIRAAVGQKIT